MAAVDQLAPQLGVIVDLAVEDDRYRAVLVPHRLRAAGEVEDGEPAVAEEDAAWPSSIWEPAPSGPRCTSACIMRVQVLGGRAAPTKPAMPHITAASPVAC